MAVLLKNFDTYFKRFNGSVHVIEGRLSLESARPTAWTKTQADDLRVIFNALSQLYNALSEMANQVRDD